MTVIQACGISPRLSLTPLRVDDIDDIQALGDDAQVFEHIPEIPIPFDARQWVGRTLSNQENYICHVVRLKGSGIPIGYVQINRRRNLDLQLGYWLGQQHWGSHYGLEAAAQALILFHSHGGRGAIFAAAHPKNIASIRILAHLGFKSCETTAPLADIPIGMIDHVMTL
ncbi:GNAT family N-acetyltransferase [Pseudomonas sp. LFM046]|uniref:GNAT family N-acetyltransferase n=1 Tax=Pseudomonas sp. LFM046 TaxID=1608357 RepID=UPI0009E4F2C5|nr:GNAT family N-acetyltransferase [Pseudomonas sp. LFM046]